MENTQEQVLHIDLTATQGKKVVVNGDESKSFRLNTTDFSIYDRLKQGLDKLYSLFGSLRSSMAETAETTDSTEDEEAAEKFDNELLESMKNVDAEMRATIDFIFSAPVSEVCAPEGYMFDLFEGQLRFEYIINALTKLYENSINAEYYKFKARINSKLPAYVGKGKK